MSTSQGVERAEGAADSAVDGAGTRRATHRRGTGRLALGSAEGLRRIVPQALVVAVLAGGATAFVAADKDVRLSVDGTARSLHTFAGDVEELLADEGLAVDEHDIVAPPPGTPLAGGDEIVVRFGRPLTLTLDGHRRQVWTTARTVEGALHQLGVRADGAFLSASRSMPISRKGLALDVRTERTVTVTAGRRERTIRTNAATVREAIEQAGLALRGQDTTSVPPGSFPRDGQTVTVTRITVGRQVREEPVPYDTVRIQDPGLRAGTEAVVQRGRNGVRRVTYALRTVNGVRHKPRKISEEVVRAPVTRRIKVGTMTGGEAGAEAGSRRFPDSAAGSDGLDWNALARCESGGRPDAVDPSGTYGGLYQFDTGTWRSMGGVGRPQDASAQEQTYRAKKLYRQRGPGPWPHCGRRLYR
ncbi:ubiquitin-like domain-containing protein [Streptomyces sp. NPDC057445]|uniref:ubiquitin-like domain-containing protein n=1 Tax=Streptomyces sp. NPDC057445 TaxID=3346136 RepID=UPI0036C3FEB0